MPTPHPTLREVSTAGLVVTISPFPAEKVTSLGKDWHRPCLRCERCGKTLTPGGHAEVRGLRQGTLEAGRLGGRGREGAHASVRREGPRRTVGAALWWPEWRFAGAPPTTG